MKSFIEGHVNSDALMNIKRTFTIENRYFYAYFACSLTEKKANAVSEVLDENRTDFFLNFNILYNNKYNKYLRNKPVADLCSCKEFS